jgi:hypothetical protein
MIDSVKEHFKKNKDVYISCGIGLVAGFTCAIVRDVISQRISRGISVTASRGISVAGKSVVMNNVSYISANRQGAPSWVVRSLDTGEIFTSQRAAAIAMGLPESEVSKHLNGIMDDVRGYTFERLCMAA